MTIDACDGNGAVVVLDEIQNKVYLESPNFPSNYPAYQNCLWAIKSACHDVSKKFKHIFTYISDHLESESVFLFLGKREKLSLSIKILIFTVLGGVCAGGYPSMHLGRPPSQERRLLLRTVRILLECILVVKLVPLMRRRGAYYQKKTHY